MNYDLRKTLEATLDQISNKLSCAESFLEGDDPEEVIHYLKEIHELSRVNATDYKK